MRSRDRARQAALLAEVVALRTTVAQLRSALEQTEAARAASAAAPSGTALLLPLVRLALAREAEPSLTREMALALSAPDRGQDIARTEIVLADLPERSLLDPKADRDGEPRDHATADSAEQASRKSA